MKGIIRIHVSRQGEEELFRFLAQSNVIFMLARMKQGASESVNLVQTIEVIRQSSTSVSVGRIISSWIKARAARNAVIHTKKRELVHVRGLNPDELVNHLEIADQISLIEADSNQRPDQVEPLVGG